MPTHQTGSRERMIQAAETLLQESGLSGAGIKQVVARSGAPVGSVYHFFPGGKTQIVTDTLRLHSAKVVRLFEHAFGDAAVPLPARLRALFRMAANGFEAAGADKSCAIAGVTLDLRMQNNRTSLAMFPLVAACITAPALATLLAAGLMQGERISRPAISEQTSPLEPIAPAARDGYRGEGFLRKPPGTVPFPVVVMIHGGLVTRPAEEGRVHTRAIH